MADLLRDKVAIVTGAGHAAGIGRAIADAFVAQGARVVITDIAGAEGLGAADGIACDVTQRDQVQNVIDVVTTEHGRVDILVNNAGVGAGSADFLQVTERDWELSLGVNVLGIANFCQVAIPAMRETGGGAIINVASLAGLGAIDSIPACYTASQFAAVGLTKQIAAQFAADGIRCNALCPGSVVTQMRQQALQLLSAQHGITLEEAQVLEESQIPLGRAAQPREVADAAVYLASDLAVYVTGVAMPVAGGMAPGL